MGSYWSLTRSSLCLALSLSALSLPAETRATPLNPLTVGCSDGTREGFTNIEQYPLVASCGGAWDIPSAFHSAPACYRVSGNDSINVQGLGCNVEDLCAEGWHVCYGPDDFVIRTSGRGCEDSVADNYPNNGTGTVQAGVSTTPGGAFFMSRTSGYGTGNCDEVVNGMPLSFNDLFGCGNIGGIPQRNCTPFNRFSNNQCISLESSSEYSGTPPSYYGYRPNEYAWICNDGGDGTRESLFVQKVRGGDQGGVLCCKDSDASLPEVCDGRDNNANGQIDEVDFDNDGLVDEKPGDYCLTSDNRDGEIVCTGRGGWECAPSQPRACCLPSGECSNLNAYRCGLAGGSVSGASCETMTDICAQPLRAEISGRTWLDANRNGIFDEGDTVLPDVELWLKGDATYQTVSDPDGIFRFNNLGVGSYTLGYDAQQSRLLDHTLSATQESPRTLPNGSWRNPSGLIIFIEPGITNASFGFIEACLTDVDEDGICDPIDPCVDADGDGYGEGPACLGPDCDDTYLYCNVDCLSDVLADGNNIPDCYEMECEDNDGDGYGIGNGCIGWDCDDTRITCTTLCSDHDSDGIPDCDDDDDDNDGLSDALELLYGSDPLNPDSDGDGLSDGDEVNIYNTSPTNPDSDGDGLSDGEEVLVHHTNPNNPDSDGNGVPDGQQYGGNGTGGNGTGGNGTGGNGTGGNGNGGTDSNANDEKSGCVGAEATPWAALLGLLALGRRRRR